MARIVRSQNEVDWSSLLDKHPIFEAMGPKDKAFVLSDEISNKLVLDANKVILRQGETGNSLFIVCEGSVSVTLEDQAGEAVRLYSLTEGEVFGEMALFGQQLRSATLTTVEPSKLLEIPGDEFLTLMKKHSEIAFYFLAKLTRRLTQNDNMILASRMTGIDTSVSDLKTKLEVLSQTTEAKLAASQTMFDQTNTRANEIIEAAGRARTRLTAMLATGTTILGLIIGGSLWELSTTMENVRGLAGTVGEHATEVKANALAAAQQAQSAEENARAGQQHLSNIEDVRQKAAEALQTATAAKNETVTIKLESLLDSLRNRFQDPPLSETASEILRLIADQDALTEEEMKQYRTRLNTLLYTNALIGENYEDIVTLYEGVKKRAPNEQTRSKLMSAYFSALAAIVSDNYDNAEQHIEEFGRMMAGTSQIERGFWGEAPFTKDGLSTAINPDSQPQNIVERRLALLSKLLEKTE